MNETGACNEKLYICVQDTTVCYLRAKMNHVILSYRNLIVVSSVMTKRKKTDEIYRMKLGDNHCVILLGVISSSDRNCSSSLSRRVDIFCFQK